MRKEITQIIDSIHNDNKYENPVALSNVVAGLSCDELTGMLCEFLTDSQLIDFIEIGGELMSLRNMESGQDHD